MNLKICSKCKISKSFPEFYLRKTGKRAGEYYEKCKECMKARGRSYYHVNRERQLSLALKRREKYRQLMRELLVEAKNKPCMDCIKSYPHYVMDFDHRNGEQKIREVARMIIGGWSKTKVLEEIEKCDLVCSNCHRIRTHRKPAGIRTSLRENLVPSQTKFSLG